jgi:predicted DnaQ family exonuclease/DinG family helicase
MLKKNINKRTYVALDLETTGLRPESDTIIEVGAVKFQNGRQLDVFQSLVNPYRPIPFRVQSLCSITQKEVDAAPPFSALTDELATFLDDYPIIGHNIGFDLSFLAQAGINLPNAAYDTYEMTKVLLPGIPDRSLSAVAAHLGVPHPSAHRALADAEVAKETFTTLLDRLYQLEPSIINELARLTAKTNWWLGDFINKVAAEKGANSLLDRSGFENACFGSLVRQKAQPLTPDPESAPLDIEYLTEFFDTDSPLAQTFPNYEKRPQQVDMMQAVANALNDSQHLIVEAGTGVGKSIAYLLPAALYAYQNNVPVVISTNTINLQEQLVHKDTPDLLGAIAVKSNQATDNIRVAQVKGRTNYLCLRRWDIQRRIEGLPMEAIQLLARIQVWLPSTQTGDRSELNIDARENIFWYRVCAQSYDCLSKQCSYYQRGLCFLHRARKAAESAHLIIVNHALLLSEIASGAQILPEYSHLIIDEAHRFDDVATDQLGIEIRERDIFDHLDQIVQENEDQKTGILPQLEYIARISDVSEKSKLKTLISSLDPGVAKARSRVSEFFNELGTFLLNYSDSEGGYDLSLRITGAMRTQPAWSDVEISCEKMLGSLASLARIIQKIDAAIEDLTTPEILKIELVSLFNANEELRRQIDSLVFHQEDNTVHWITLGRRNNLITLYSAPLHVGPLLQQPLYFRNDTLVLTGATLSTEGNFNYLKERLGIESAEELLLGSPFDYEHAALTYLVSDIPEPGRNGYQKAVAEALVPLCRATEGRCLVLFTSHSALRTTQANIQGLLEEDNILTLAQGLDGSPRKLLSSLKNNPRTVLLGAASFWEGVDVVGDALSLLVIVRLPFNVPTDPVFAARSETFENPFTEYALPQTAFKFKQGFGRLIRSKQDRGVMVVLDSRLANKKYAPVFMNSLPPCRIEKGSWRNLPKTVTEWLDLRDQDFD